MSRLSFANPSDERDEDLFSDIPSRIVLDLDGLEYFVESRWGSTRPYLTCQFGMTSRDELGPGLCRKPTRLLTNMESVADGMSEDIDMLR